MQSRGIFLLKLRHLSRNDPNIGLPETVWLLRRAQARPQLCETVADCSDQGVPLTEDITDTTLQTIAIPTWSGDQSTINSVMPVVRIGAPPLLAAPAHELSTLLTVLMQAQGLNAKVMGPSRKTVVTLDLGLYKPAKQLQMARQDMGNLIIRPGELHIVMAQLRSIGAYIENSGIDFCWIESNLYGSATVKQIIEGKHVVRGQTAHTVTLESLFALYQEAFFAQHPQLQSFIKEAVIELEEAFRDGNSENIMRKHTDLTSRIVSEKVLEKMNAFDEQKKKPTSVLCHERVHADGLGDVAIHQSSAHWRLEPTLGCTGALRQVLLRS